MIHVENDEPSGTIHFIPQEVSVADVIQAIKSRIAK
jgi:hypothetical protein